MVRLVRPGAALETGTVVPAVIGAKVSAPCRAGIVGGTAEGLPFVPDQLGWKAFLLSRSHAREEVSWGNIAFFPF